MITALIVFCLGVQGVDLPEVRYLFTVAEKNEASCENLLQMTDGYTMDYDPLAFAYHAAAEMTMANHVSWPGTKLSYFNGGKSKLEKVVKKYNDNVELRYIRFAVQYGSPSFLGYRDNIEEDRQFVIDNIDKAVAPADHKKRMKDAVSRK